MSSLPLGAACASDLYDDGRTEKRFSHPKKCTEAGQKKTLHIRLCRD
jgi:hypothetical protein